MPNDTAESEAVDTRLIRKLADILKSTGLSEIEVEKGDLKIRVARQVTPRAAAVPVHYAAEPGMAPAPAQSAPAAEAPPRGEAVKSPMVGTVYLQSTPGEPAFVKPGDRVAAGQTLLIVEAMKTMNPIPAPRDGVVLEVVAEDGQPVEFGELLVVLE